MSKLNCMPGQICRVVGHPAQAHVLVSTRRLLTADEAVTENVRMPAWDCEALCGITGENKRSILSGGTVWIADRALRPLDGDGEDEMLRIAGKPQETPADVIQHVLRERA